MTRKHFVLIAKALRDAKPKDFQDSTQNYDEWWASNRTWEDTVTAMSYALVGENPRFDRDRFEVAAGMKKAS